MAEKSKFASLTALSNGGTKVVSASDRASINLRVAGDRLEIVQSLPLHAVTLTALSETPKMKGKPIFLSAKGVPVNYAFPIPADWPVEEDRGKTFAITLTATVGPSALTGMQATVAEIPATTPVVTTPVAKPAAAK